MSENLLKHPPILDSTGQMIAYTLRGMGEEDALSIYKNAMTHNSIYMGRNLGTSVTDAQWESIKNGTFEDLYIGDYWVINEVNWRIAHFDYWYGTGDTGNECKKHHIVIVPDSNLATTKMNSSNTTAGGYLGSGFYTGTNADSTENTAFTTAKTAINTAFGESHILNHRELLTNAVSSGVPSGVIWTDSTVDLMNECMVYGHQVWCKHKYDTGIDRTILALFDLDPSRLTIRAYWWLRSVSSSATFASVSNYGVANLGSASDSFGVRPCFGITA